MAPPPPLLGPPLVDEEAAVAGLPGDKDWPTARTGVLDAKSSWLLMLFGL